MNMLSLGIGPALQGLLGGGMDQAVQRDLRNSMDLIVKIADSAKTGSQSSGLVEEFDFLIERIKKQTVGVFDTNAREDLLNVVSLLESSATEAKNLATNVNESIKLMGQFGQFSGENP